MKEKNMDSNNKKPLVSIILPVYNTKPYLAKCLDSVCNQTYTNLEIICIDDGSTDGSELILDEFKSRDDRIKMIHKANRGESNARNTGLRMMTGEYIGFIDCDDWIEPDMYERLVGLALEKNVEMVASTWYRETIHDSIKIQNQLPVSTNTFDRESLLNYVYRRDYYRGFAYMWDKLYRKNLFYDRDGNLILFDEDLKLGGDVLYLARLIFNTNKACYIDEAYYHYLQRDESGCHTKNIAKRLDWLKAYEKLIKYIEENNIQTEAELWIKRFLAYHSSNVAELAYEQRDMNALVKSQQIMNMYKTEYLDTNTGNLSRINRYEEILTYKLQ